MTTWQRAAFAVATVALGLAVGCDTQPPPVAPAKKIDDTNRPPELAPPTKPTQSEPAAAQLLAEVVAAHTGGQPDRLAKLKACSFTRTGMIEAPGGRLAATWKVDLHWPDRYRFHNEMQIQKDGVTITRHNDYVTTPAGAWQAESITQSGQLGHQKWEKGALPPDALATLKSQFREDAVMLLFPLADTATVAARGPDEKVDGADLLGLHVWTPALEYARLGVDKKTKLLTRLVYLGRESLTDQVKELTVLEHTDADGVKLPGKLTVKANGLPRADWTKLTVTPTPPDPKRFDAP